MYHARQTMLNVEESDRLSFLPDLFGNDFLAGEMQVYALAEKHITDYCGGFWHFIRIPEGGGYMMPDGDRFHLTNPDNPKSGQVKPLSYGFISQDDLAKQFLYVSSDFKPNF